MKLYDHQQKVIDEDPKKCGLFLGTGSGKTRIALLLARGSTLVIAPKTQVEDQNWEREYKELEQGEGTRINGLYVISKETFRRDHAFTKMFDTVIVDEAHTCLGVTPNTKQRKGIVTPKTSQLFEALETFLERTKPERLYLCTATIMKSPMTVWGAAQLLLKDEYLHADRHKSWSKLDSFMAFRYVFYTKLPMPGRDVWVPKQDDNLKDMLATAVKCLGYTGRLEDYFDVPEQTFITKYIELAAAQKARIKELPMEFPDPIVLIGKKHQVENGVLAGDEFNEPEVFDNSKIDAILNLAEEFSRMIVFAKYSAQIEVIQKALSEAKYYTWTLTGKTTDRAGVIKQANEMDGVLIVQAQISAGWEVPNTPVMVFASRTYSWVDYVQAQGRILRANALKKNLYINLVVKGGIDEAVDKSLANKQSFDERLYLGI